MANRRLNQEVDMIRMQEKVEQMLLDAGIELDRPQQEQFDKGFKDGFNNIPKAIVNNFNEYYQMGLRYGRESRRQTGLEEPMSNLQTGDDEEKKGPPETEMSGDGKPYAIHSVIIKKNVPKEDAMEMAQDILKKKSKMTELKNTYRFRNIPKTKFQDYRSKKINKNITLVFGELKPQFARLQGKGIFDYFKKGYEYVKEKAGNVMDAVKEKVSNVKDAVSNYLQPKLDDYPNFTKKMLTQYGNDKVTKLTMYRKPIGEYLNTVINAVSLGKWNQLVKKAGYDKFFHLSLIAEVKGEKLNIEKTDVVSISKDIPEGEGTEMQDVPLDGKSFTLNELMAKTRDNMGDRAYFEYDGFKNNCQLFVSNLLKSQGLYGAKEKAFAYQPIQEIIDELPDYVKNFQRGVTDVSATLKRITGQGTPEQNEFIQFLQQKGLKKKPSDAQLKKLYKEFKGVKKVGKGFWDDFKRGFNMVFEPAAKYVLKPLMTLSGTPAGLAGVAGLSALGYGKDTPRQEGDWPIYKAPRHPPKRDENKYGGTQPISAEEYDDNDEIQRLREYLTELALNLVDSGRIDDVDDFLEQIEQIIESDMSAEDLRDFINTLEGRGKVGGNIWRSLADGVKMGLDSYKSLGEDDKQNVKDTAKDALKKMAASAAVGFFEHKVDEANKLKGGDAFSATNQTYNDIQSFFNKLVGKGQKSQKKLQLIETILRL